MRTLVLVTPGQHDQRGNLLRLSREKAAALSSELPGVIGPATIFLHDGTMQSKQTLVWIARGAGLADESYTLEEVDALTAHMLEGPTRFEMETSRKEIFRYETKTAVASMDRTYLLEFVDFLTNEEFDLRDTVKGGDAVVVDFDENHLVLTHEVISPRV